MRKYADSCVFGLQHLLRQGRAAVQVIHELEVISTEYLQDASLAREHAGGQRAMPAMSVYTIVKGRLHIRLGNIGKLCAVVLLLTGFFLFHYFELSYFQLSACTIPSKCIK